MYTLRVLPNETFDGVGGSTLPRASQPVATGWAVLLPLDVLRGLLALRPGEPSVAVPATSRAIALVVVAVVVAVAVVVFATFAVAVAVAVGVPAIGRATRVASVFAGADTLPSTLPQTIVLLVPVEGVSVGAATAVVATVRTWAAPA